MLGNYQCIKRKLNCVINEYILVFCFVFYIQQLIYCFSFLKFKKYIAFIMDKLKITAYIKLLKLYLNRKTKEKKSTTLAKN